MEYGGQMPIFARILMAAKDWGCPPWEVENGDIEWFWRWEYFTAQVQDKERREAKAWQQTK